MACFTKEHNYVFTKILSLYNSFLEQSHKNILSVSRKMVADGIEPLNPRQNGVQADPFTSAIF